MIKHIVMWTVAGNNRTEKLEAANKIKAAFEGLRGRIPGMTHIEIGIDFSEVAHACEAVLYSEFENRKDLDNYATHSEHLRVRDELLGLRLTRHQVDYFA